MLYDLKIYLHLQFLLESSNEICFQSSQKTITLLQTILSHKCTLTENALERDQFGGVLNVPDRDILLMQLVHNLVVFWMIGS